ncbi:MAG: ATP-binding cassette domain-containing protein [Clostridia bacterium]|nr:ATP-binding cassette domain-containing protein [Clostridia bacterium]
MSQLIFENISIGYEGKAVAENISFSVGQGDYLCILGANGSGKSTLIKTILRLQEPLKGSFESCDGFNFGEIGYLPQQMEMQRDFPASVQEIIMSGFLNRSRFLPFYKRSEKQKAEQIMNTLEIFELRKSLYRNLSGGQKQRVLLARAMCAAVGMILLDEPASGLDSRASSEMYESISRINRDGTTVIMVTHDHAVAMKYASHILCVGKKVGFYTKEEYCGRVVKNNIFDKGENDNA